MSKKINSENNKRRLLPATIGFTVLAALTRPAHAFEFAAADGELKGSLDTTISYGALWRAQSRDPANVGITNGGTARSVNDDDGNLNYGRGDLVSSLVKATHDLDLSYRNYGFFGRVLYFYDDAVARKDGLPPEAHQRLDSDIRLLDAYARGRWDLGGRALNARLGNQVVSWGESTFIPNGINSINPVDVARLRAPGSEVKEGLLPVPMLWASKALTDNVSLETFYQFRFVKTRLEPRGSFFSTSDIASPGADRAFLGFGRTADQHGVFGPQTFVSRMADRDPSNSGQFGAAARTLLPGLNNTELSVYALNYHSRTPFLSGTKARFVDTNGDGVADALPPSTANYFLEYPENIRLFGVGANSSGPFGIALQGEYSYRPNQPLQIASSELLLAGLGGANLADSGLPNGPGGAGQYVGGYKRVQMHQIQLTATKSLGRLLAAEQTVFIGEIGFTHLNLPDNVRFAAPGVVLSALSTPSAFGSVQNGGFATQNSYGYRLLLRSEYPNAVESVNLTPRIAFSHDVKGSGPTFNEGARAVTVGVSGTFRQRWQADLSYTSYYGGKTFGGTDPASNPFGQPSAYATTGNPLKDRDLIAATISYSF
ncbi:MAG: DUF1302 domain-containing protein [Burkholderiaceae bacterium]